MSLNQTNQDGFTLLEILVSLIILSIGLLGLAHLQISTLRYSQTAEFRSIASQLAFDIFDRMRANQIHADNDGAYEISLNSNLGDCKTESSFGSNAAQASKDLICWKEKVSKVLPQGDGSIACNPYVAKQPFICTVTIQWNEVPLQEGPAVVASFSYSGAI